MGRTRETFSAIHVGRRVLRSAAAVALVCAITGLRPFGAEAQSMPQVLKFLQDGGAWLSLEIEDGRGTFEGLRVPTMGMSLIGWFQVGDMHRGEWSIRVVDLEADPNTPVIDVDVTPGQQVPFAYEPGSSVQVKVDVEWSEPQDTVLWVWVGVPGGSGG